MRHAVLYRTDTILHTLLDQYVDSKRPGWSLLQLGQWHVCQWYERSTFTK